MLYLNRKENQSLIIGEKIKIKVVRTARGQVYLGIEAPDDVSVHREELFNELKEEGKLLSLVGRRHSSAGMCFKSKEQQGEGHGREQTDD